MERIKFIKKLMLVVVWCLVINYIFFNFKTLASNMLDDLYRYEENIDTLFLGSSVMFCSCNPQIADELLKQNTFTASSSGQIKMGSFCLLREIMKKHEIKTVFLDVLFSPMQENSGDIRATYDLIDYMKNNLDKVKVLWEVNKTDGVVNMLFPVLNHHINPVVALKQRFIGMDATTLKSLKYQRNGFVLNSLVANEDTKFEVSTVSIDPLSPVTDYSYQYLLEITEYCKQKNIELILVATPVPDATLINEKYYEEYTQFIQKYVCEHELKYWDFCLSKETFLTMDICEYADEIHINKNGAEKFTKALCNLYLDIKSGNITEKEVFYDTYAEKLQNNMDNTVLDYPNP